MVHTGGDHRLLCKLTGCAAHLMNGTLTIKVVATVSPDQQALHAARPAWAVAGYAIAVWGGAFGCTGLIMKKQRAEGPISAPVYALHGMVLVIAMLMLLADQDGGATGVAGVTTPESA